MAEAVSGERIDEVDERAGSQDIQTTGSDDSDTWPTNGIGGRHFGHDRCRLLRTECQGAVGERRIFTRGADVVRANVHVAPT